jgi:hypothetical protein
MIFREFTKLEIFLEAVKLILAFALGLLFGLAVCVVVS